MQVKRFAKETAEGIQEYLPPEYRDLVFTVVEVPKNNGVIRTGICGKKEGESVSPVIYLDGYCEEVRQGGEKESVMRRIAEEIRAGREIGDPVKGIDWKEYSSAAPLLRLMAVNTKANREVLSSLPHIRMADLSGIACLEIPVSETCGRVKVTNALLESWGVGKQEVFDTALKNMEEKAGLELTELETMLQETLSGCSAGENLLNGSEAIPENELKGLYLLSNQERTQGAAALFSPLVRRRIGERFPDGVYILPSSVHEVLLVPKRIPVSPAELGRMVREINREQVAKEEVLSDHIYEYDKERGTIRTVPESKEKRRERER